jgi:hypothetical protein
VRSNAKARDKRELEKQAREEAVRRREDGRAHGKGGLMGWLGGTAQAKKEQPKERRDAA